MGRLAQRRVPPRSGRTRPTRAGDARPGRGAVALQGALGWRAPGPRAVIVEKRAFTGSTAGPGEPARIAGRLNEANPPMGLVLSSLRSPAAPLEERLS